MWFSSLIVLNSTSCAAAEQSGVVLFAPDAAKRFSRRRFRTFPRISTTLFASLSRTTINKSQNCHGIERGRHGGRYFRASQQRTCGRCLWVESRPTVSAQKSNGPLRLGHLRASFRGKLLGRVRGVFQRGFESRRPSDEAVHIRACYFWRLRPWGPYAARTEDWPEHSIDLRGYLVIKLWAAGAGRLRPGMKSAGHVGSFWGGRMRC